MSFSFIIKIPTTPWTWDPLNSNANVTLSNSDLTVTADSAGTNRTTISTGFKNTGKWYWEIYTDVLNGFESYGYCLADVDFTKDTRAGFNESWAWLEPDRNYHDGSYSANLPNLGPLDVIQCAIDIDNGKLWYGLNGGWPNLGDPATGANPARTDTTIIGQNVYACCTMRGNGSQATARFLSSQFTYTPPSGFSPVAG